MIYVTKGLIEKRMYPQNTHLSDFEWMCERKPKICHVNDRTEIVIINRKTGKEVIKAKFDGEYFLAGKMVEEKGAIYRENKNLLEKSLIVIDIDDVDITYENLIRHLIETLGEYRFLVYKTVSHGIKGTRVRIIIEPERAMNQAEYKRTVESVGSKILIEYDKSTKTWSQQMGLPITYEDVLEDYKPYINSNSNHKKYPVVSLFKENNDNRKYHNEIKDLGKIDQILQMETIKNYVEFNKENLREYKFFIDALMHLRKAVFLKEITIEEAEEHVKILGIGNIDWIKDNVSILRESLKNNEITAKRSFMEFFSIGNLNVCQNNSFITDDGKYYSKKKYSKNGDLTLNPISNFRLIAKEIIKGDVETFLKTDVVCDNNKIEKLINIKCFNNKRDFMDCILDYNHWFKGKDDDIQDIKKIIFEHEYKVKTGVSYMGFHKIDGKKTFVTNTKSIDYKGNIISSVELTNNNMVLKSNILEIEEITKEELKLIAPYMFNFNTLGITSSVWGSIVGFLLKPVLNEINIKMHHLGIFGESGSGKSETAENIIIPFFSLEQKMLGCSDVTQFALLKNLASSNSFPLLLNEYKPLKMSDVKKNLLSECLRNTYDGHFAERGNKDQTLSVYPLRAGIVIIGEEAATETAITERSLNVVLSKFESYKLQRTEAFKFLKKNQILLSKLGRSILSIVIKFSNKDFIEEIEHIKKTYINREFIGRIRITATVTMLGITVITKLFSKLDLEFEKETGVKISEIQKSINDLILADTLEGYTKSKSTIDKTIELMDTMCANKALNEGEDYTFIKGTEIALNVNKFYPLITEFIKKKNLTEEIILNKDQFTKQLRKTEYFVDYRAVKIGGTTLKCYVLNIQSLREKNLNLDNLIKSDF